MKTIAKRLIVTRQPPHRVLGWHKHRRKRVAKKYRESFVFIASDPPRPPQDVIADMQQLHRYIEFTELCKRQIARYLRRSGMTIKVYTQAQMDDMMRATNTA